MRLQRYMINEISIPSWILNSFNKIKKIMSKMTFKQFEKECKQSFNEIKSLIDPNELSAFLKKLGISESGLKAMFKEEVINEDAKHWWELIKQEAFPTLAFYPALQIWLELDKMLKGTEYSGKIISFYAAFWLLLVSGKYVKGWLDWKKENPTEYEKEKSWGGGDII